MEWLPKMEYLNFEMLKNVICKHSEVANLSTDSTNITLTKHLKNSENKHVTKKFVRRCKISF